MQYEAYQDFDNKRFKGVHEKGRMRRMPDFLSVCLQDVMHCGKPELRENQINVAARVSSDSGRCFFFPYEKLRRWAQSALQKRFLCERNLIL